MGTNKASFHVNTDGNVVNLVTLIKDSFLLVVFEYYFSFTKIDKCTILPNRNLVKYKN